MKNLRFATVPTVVACVLIGSAPSSAQPASSEPSAAPAAGSKEASPIVLESSAFLAAHMLLRARLEAGEDSAQDDPLASAMGALRAVAGPNAPRAMIGLVDAAAAAANSPGEFAQACQRLPERAPSRTEEPGPAVREPALAYAKALADAWPAYAARDIGAQDKAVKDAISRLRPEVEAHGRDCLQSIAGWLDLAVPADPIRVVIVPRAPFPGGFTFRTRSGTTCVVSTGSHEGTALLEAVVHECVHAMDVANRERGMLNKLRAAIAEAGTDATSPLTRDLPHTLMFAASAEAIRKNVDPAHKDYGATAGYYAKVPVASAAVLPVWKELAAGKTTREDAVAAIVAAAYPAAAK